MPNVQALYRIWRSKRFDEVIGQDAIVRTLREQVRTGSIAHAYLFSGPRGTGKTSVAQIFARAMNCLDSPDGEPCGHCGSCVALSTDNNFDVLEIDAASNNRVDDARDLIERVKYPPSVTRYRVYIIDEAHMLTTPAFNALLKTLEEPPPHAVFILATTEPRKLPDTILSRCQWYAFRRIDPRLITERLELAARTHGIPFEPEALRIIARTADGGMRDAFSLLDVCRSTATGGVVTAALVRETLGAADPAVLFLLANALISMNTGEALRLAGDCFSQGMEPQELAASLTEHIRALLLAKYSDDPQTLLSATESDANAYREQAARATRESLLRMLDLFSAASQTNKWNASPRLMLERALLRSCVPDESLELESLAARIESLERKLDTGTITAPIEPKQTDPPKDLRKPQALPIPELSTKTLDKKNEKQATPIKQEPSQPQRLSLDAIWAALLASLKTQQAKLYAFARGGKPVSYNADELKVLYVNENAIYYDMLKKDANRQLVESILSQAAGAPTRFTPINTDDMPAPKPKENQAKLQQVYDKFGRENVSVTDSDNFEKL